MCSGVLCAVKMLCVLYERVSSRRRWIEVVKKCESLRQLFYFFSSSFSSSFNSTSACAVSCSLGFAKATLLCHIWWDFVFHFKCMRVYRPIHGCESRFFGCSNFFTPAKSSRQFSGVHAADGEWQTPTQFASASLASCYSFSFVQ